MILLSGRFENTLVMPETIFHAWVLSDSISSLLCTSLLISVATTAILSDPRGIFVYFVTRTTRGERCSLKVITSCAL